MSEGTAAEQAESDSQASWDGRSVVVTGGTGFIGRHLCRSLVERGAKVTVLSRSADNEGMSSFGLEHVACLRTSLLETASEPAEAGNDAWRSLFEELEPEVVFHLAGLVKGTRDRSAVLPMLHANTELAVRLMDAAVHVECSRFVQAGSLEEPGDLSSTPASPYAVSKLAASAYARLFSGHYGLSTAVARIFMVYGPGPQDQNKLVPYVIRRLLAGDALELSDGLRPVDWIFVEDVAEGLVALAHSEADQADLGTGQLHTVRAVVERIADQIDFDGVLPFGSRSDREQERVRCADLEGSALGWRPSTDLETGLERTIDWFRRSHSSGA